MKYQKLKLSLTEISSVVGRPRPTIQSIIDKYGNIKSLKFLPRSGRQEIHTPQDKRCIIRSSEKDPKPSVPKIAKELEKKGVIVSISTIRNTCHNECYHDRVSKKNSG